VGMSEPWTYWLTGWFLRAIFGFGLE